jgi:molybdate transport system ATP-binding protein
MIDLDFRLALPAFTLEVELALSGKAAVILGPSGAGKTSFLEVIAGLRPRAQGRVAVGGVTFLDSDEKKRLRPEERRIGYVPQDPSLFPHLDVAANLGYSVRVTQPSVEKRVADVVELLEIGNLLTRFPRTLSGGEAQRVALGRALIAEPRLLLLDEPLAALDARLRDRILPYLVRVRDHAKIAILCVTHHIGEALMLADEAIVLRAGRVEAVGRASDVLTPRLVTSVRGDATFENIVHGVIDSVDEDTGTAMLTPIATRSTDDDAAPRLTVPARPISSPGRHAIYRVASEDVLLLRSAPEGISARNVFSATCVAVEPLAHERLVRLQRGGVEWRATVTSQAARELTIEAGRILFVAIKTHSFEPLG